MKRKKKKQEWLNVERVAELLEVSVRTVWRLDETEKLPAPYLDGRLKRWKRDELKLWLELDRPSRKAFEVIKQKG